MTALVAWCYRKWAGWNRKWAGVRGNGGAPMGATVIRRRSLSDYRSSLGCPPILAVRHAKATFECWAVKKWVNVSRRRFSRETVQVKTKRKSGGETPANQNIGQRSAPPPASLVLETFTLKYLN